MNIIEWLKNAIQGLLPNEEQVGTVIPISTEARPCNSKNQNSEKVFTKPEKERKEDIKNSLGMRFSYIPAGKFIMGSNFMNEEMPPHKVTISKPFYLSKITVTQEQFQDIMGFNPAFSQGENLPALNMLASAEGDQDFFNEEQPETIPEILPDLPVENVTWHEAEEFCKKLSDREGRKYRLPTEAEWEYACRAGSDTDFYWGNQMDECYCNFASLFAIRGARRKPNQWGLYDMLGNVLEWCQDWKASYPATEAKDPIGPSDGGSKINRGGSYDLDIASNCRCASRFSDSPNTRRPDVGFRVLLEIK